MNRADVEVIVRSVMREYGIQSEIRHVALFAREWKIELVNIDGVTETLTIFDGSPQNFRRSVMAALDLEV